MADSKFAEDLLKNYPQLTRVVGWFSLAALVLGYCATTLGHINTLRKSLFDLLGPEHLLTLHFGVASLVAALLVVGWLALVVWIDRRFLARMQPRKRYTSLTVLLALAVALAGTSIYAGMPAPPDVRALLARESRAMADELLASGEAAGGVRYNRVDHSVEPQVWATAQAVVAVLAHGKPTPEDAGKLRAHLDFTDRVRLPGDEGWGYMEPVDWGVTEIAAWVALAHVASLGPEAAAAIWGGDSEVAVGRVLRDLALLRKRQLANGSWAPVAQNSNPAFARTYSTAMALWALVEARSQPRLARQLDATHDEAIKKGLGWLLARFRPELSGWVPNPERSRQNEHFPGLTAQVLYVLGRARPLFPAIVEPSDAYRNAWLALVRQLEGTAAGAPLLAARAARVNDRTHDSDRYLPRSKFMVEGSTFLWFPWVLAVCPQSASVPVLKDEERVRAASGCRALLGRVHELMSFAREDPFVYVMAETLLAINLELASVTPAAPAPPAAVTAARH